MHDRVLAAAIVAAGVVAIGSGVASAQEARTVYAPMTFYTETHTLRTTACLQLTERVYPSTAWWASAPDSGSGPEHAFKSVIAAIKGKDRAALLKLTDPAQASDTARFDQQAGAFFQQFQSIQMLEVPRAYEFDGLLVFFGKFQSATQTVFVPLVFAHEADNTFGFLPSRTRQATFTLVNDWFAPSEAPPADAPAYCTDADVRRATHRVVLGSSTWQPVALLLTGAPLDAPAPAPAIAARVKSTLDQMRAALRKPGIDDFLPHMTSEGAGRLKQWFAVSNQSDRDAYKAAFIDQQPFFVFDESSLLVVYTRTAAKDVQVLYFTVTEDKRLLWTNSSHITVADQVFKQGPLFAAAASTPPFRGVVIKK